MKKAITMLLIGMLVVSMLLTGCTTDNNGKSTESSGSGTATVTTAPAGPVQEKPVKIMWTSSSTSNEADDARVKAYIEEKSGVKFEPVRVQNPTDFETQVNLNLASNVDIDVILRTAGNVRYQSLLERNAIQKINEPLKKYGSNLLKNIDPNAWKVVTDEFKNIYGIPTQNPLLGQLIAVRKDWREKLKMGTITTLEEFEKYLAAVRDGDLDGNKVADTIPLTAYSTSTQKYYELEMAMLYLFLETDCGDNGSFWDYVDANGNITPVFMHHKYKDYLATLAKWTKDGLLSKDVPVVSAKQIDDQVGANRVGAVGEYYSRHLTPIEVLLKTVPEAEYEFITPKTISGKDYKTQVNGSSIPFALFVSYSKNVDWAIKLFDWTLASKENYWTIKGGVKGTDWDVIDAGKNSLKKLKAVEKVDEGYNSRYGFMFYGPWDIEFESASAKLKKMYEIRRWYKAYNSYNLTPDWFMTYNFKGTPIETSQEDMNTLIQENRTKIILGELPVDEWDKVIEKYKKTFGDEFIKRATEQYKTFGKK